MEQELWDLYTKYREKTGLIHTRGEELPDSYYHLTVDVWIKNKKGEYIISKRAATRPTYPLKWECVGGSVLQGETSIMGAIREVKEEVGVDLQPSMGRLLFSKIRDVVNGKKSNSIMDAWLFEYDGEITFEDATTDEVEECRWMTLEEINALYDNDEFVDVLEYYKYALEYDEPDYSKIIGQTVTGIVDRPLGTCHPKYQDILYKLNYGYVDGIFAADGEEQDVYVFGYDRPIEEFTGRVIAVYHRFNDVEDKWIVYAGEDNNEPTDEKILAEIDFQEKYFWGKLYR